MKNLLITILISLACLASADSTSAQLAPFSVSPPGIFRVRPTADLGRGVNFGNMLEAPNEGDWGLFVEEIFFDRVVDARLEHIRLPVSWTHHAQTNTPYTIDATFFERVDWVIEQARNHGLKVILNNHHYDQLNSNPLAEKDRALAIWQQISTRYQSIPDDELYFEILNEPHDQFNSQPELWNQFMVDGLEVIRQSNPHRKVLVGPVFYNSIDSLNTLQLPKDDNLIATVHFYSPFLFTHQGAEWIDPTPPIGPTWEGDLFQLTNPLQNWSWGTTLSEGNNGLTINYEDPFSGFQVHNPNGFTNGQSVTFTVDQALPLKIRVSNNNSGEFEDYFLTTQNGTQSYTIDISSFGNSNTITNIFLQNNTNGAQPPFLLSQFEITEGNQSFPIISTGSDAIRNSFRSAYLWGLVNNIPVHVGEFGAYQYGDMESRARWTQAVRVAADSFKMDWSYWELGAGFGFYDPNNDSFRLPLLQALVPEFEK